MGQEIFPAAVDTVTGDITAWVDPDAEATIVLATSGEITTDFSIVIDFRYHEEPAKHGRLTIRAGATIEGGATKVRLTSRRGAVSVLRRHPPESRPVEEVPRDR